MSLAGPVLDPGSPAARLDTLPLQVPKLTLGYEAIRWAVKWLIQPNGPRAGERFAPTPRQVLFWLHWYSVNPDGTWCYQHGVRRLAKGSGKSPNAAVYSLLELCAPVRVDRFVPISDKHPGGVIGKPVSMPLVQIAAVSEKQTANTMRMVRAFAPKRSRVAQAYELDPGKTQYNKGDDGKLEILTTSAATAEGAEATAAVGDETEWWLKDAGAEFMNTLADNLAKSQSRMLETCNSWKPGIGSVAEKTFDTWVEQEEKLIAGTTKPGSPRTLYDARIAPPDTDMQDYDSLLAALEWVYEDCWWINPSGLISRVWSKSAKPDDSKRKYLNWPTVPEGAWADLQAWDANNADGQEGRPHRPLVDGERIVLFFDGSKSRDATALVGCCMSDGHVFTAGTWEPTAVHEKAAEGEDTAQISPIEVDARVEATWARFDVVAFFADVREFEGYAKHVWPERYRDKIETKLWAVPAGKMPEPIAWDMRSHGREFAFAAELVEAEIRENAFTHDGNAVTRRHVVNCRKADTRWGVVTVSKETPNSPDKIDAAVCVIGARMLYRIALAGASEPVEDAEAFFMNRW